MRSSFFLWPRKKRVDEERPDSPAAGQPTASNDDQPTATAAAEPKNSRIDITTVDKAVGTPEDWDRLPSEEHIEVTEASDEKALEADDAGSSSYETDEKSEVHPPPPIPHQPSLTPAQAPAPSLFYRPLGPPPPPHPHRPTIPRITPPRRQRHTHPLKPSSSTSKNAHPPKPSLPSRAGLPGTRTHSLHPNPAELKSGKKKPAEKEMVLYLRGACGFGCGDVCGHGHGG